METGRMRGGKPWIEVRQILALDVHGQIEKIALVRSTAVGRAAAAFPDIPIDRVKRIVNDNLFARREIALG